MLRTMLGLLHCIRRPFQGSFAVFTLTFMLLTASFPALGDQPQPVEKQTTTEPEQKEFKRFQVVFELDAYYTDLDFVIALTRNPILDLGEKTEAEIYATLLTRAAVLPQFLVLEASINPLPYFGTYVRSHWKRFYQDAQLSDNFNWIKTLTAGFEEPYAFSVLVGNVANFEVPGLQDTKGLGYSGYLISYGNFHIKDNRLISDDWWEFEWKMKGDRKSPVKKLNWSFRIGAKEHSNPNITDILYVSFRRSRVDYKSEGSFLFNNSGFEYTYSMDRRSFSAIQHYLTVDKKWPLESWRIAPALGLGFVWESSRKYTGSLARGRDNFQFIIRPNIEF
jgi:hypothetical protein